MTVDYSMSNLLRTLRWYETMTEIIIKEKVRYEYNNNSPNPSRTKLTKILPTKLVPCPLRKTRGHKIQRSPTLHRMLEHINYFLNSQAWNITRAPRPKRKWRKLVVPY